MILPSADCSSINTFRGKGAHMHSDPSYVSVAWKHLRRGLQFEDKWNAPSISRLLHAEIIVMTHRFSLSFLKTDDQSKEVDFFVIHAALGLAFFRRVFDWFVTLIIAAGKP